MKKKYVAIIAFSASCLLLGSLVYCGISAFPEILETESHKEIVNEPKQRIANEETIIVPQETFFEKEEPVIITNDLSGAIVSNHVSSNDEKAVYTPIKISFSGVSSESHKTQKIETIEREDVTFLHDEPVVSISVPTIAIEPEITHDVEIVEERVSYSSRQSINSEKPVKVKKAKKVVSKPNNHKELIECSLLVVAAVDIISMLLVVHRRRKLLK